MDGVAIEDPVDTKSFLSVNERLAQHVLQKAIDAGVRVFCVCGGKRSSLLIWILKDNPWLEIYDWYEERSAAFFALGKARARGEPAAVLVTSGTAVGELLPAAMEAHYTSAPLLLITADRPRRMRGSGAPQTAEQLRIFGCYPSFEEDLEGDEESALASWDRQGPAHMNVCLEEPLALQKKILLSKPQEDLSFSFPPVSLQPFSHWLHKISAPLVVVGALPSYAQEPVVLFLQKLAAPAYLEGLSGLRETASLQPLRIEHLGPCLWNRRERYPFDSVLRIGGMPTHRFWRDLEEMKSDYPVFSLSSYPFSGLSGGDLLCLRTPQDWKGLSSLSLPTPPPFHRWKEEDLAENRRLLHSFQETPRSELSWIHRISRRIPAQSLIYLGNSLPVREWDRAAASLPKQWTIAGNRGLNGIDGQLSTFFGMCRPDRENWGIFGDLTLLYDLASFWILPRLSSCTIRIAVINNGGGKIFEMLPRGEELASRHGLHFKPVADLWGIPYQLWKQEEDDLQPLQMHQFVEVVPDDSW